MLSEWQGPELSMTFTILLDATKLSVPSFRAAVPGFSRTAGVVKKTLFCVTQAWQIIHGKLGIYDLNHVLKALKKRR